MRLEHGLDTLRLGQEAKLLMPDNVAKGDNWSYSSLHELFQKALIEMGELLEAINDYEKLQYTDKDITNNIIYECADVANYLAMICDKVSPRKGV